MTSSILRRVANRALHTLARALPGSRGLRPFLHRLRGVRIGTDVFIGDEVYIENEFPEAVEIQDGAQISLRTVILAHTRGPGKVIIEKDAFIGACAVIATVAGKTLRVGEGSVVGPLCVITKDVPARTFIANESAKPSAQVTVPLSKAKTISEFIRGLAPIRTRAPAAKRKSPSEGSGPRREPTHTSEAMEDNDEAK